MPVKELRETLERYPGLVLDSSAILAHFQGKMGPTFLKDMAAKVKIPLVALCEVYRVLLRQKKRAEADHAIGSLNQMGIPFLPLTEKVSLEAGRLGHQYHLSLGDSLIAAAALCERLPLLTYDADFQQLALEIRVVKLS